MSWISTEVGQIVPDIDYSTSEPEPEEFVPDPDYADLDAAEMAELTEKVNREQGRRETLVRAVVAADRALATYRAAAGIRDGMEWRDPEGYLDAVQPGETRVWEGDLYENTSGQPVTHSPGVAPDSWTLVEEGVEPVEPDPAEYPVWAPDVDLIEGDLVTFEGVLWEVVTPHRSQVGWEPAAGYMWRLA